MRLIDVDKLREYIGLGERCGDCERDDRDCQYERIFTRMDICGWLDEQKIIEVVRCKDCIHCGFCGEATNLEVMGFYGFCSRGKQKEEEHENQ